MAFKKLLKSFLKPEWQHKKADVRKQALRSLDAQKSQDLPVIEQLALGDLDASVRRLAVKRLLDLDKLLQIASNDADNSVCQAATARFNNLFAGLEANGPELSVRLARLETVQDQELIQFLSKQGKEAALRLATLAYLDREALLGDIAINDPDPDVRLAAVDRISKQSTLERVLKNTRSKDKKVSKQVKQKIATREAEQARPTRLKQRARQCCIELEAMLDSGNRVNTSKQLQDIETNWQTAREEWDKHINEVWDEALTTRYTSARAGAISKFEEHEKQLEQKKALEAERYPLRAAKTAWCEELEHMLPDLQQAGLSASEISTQTRQAVDAKRATWKESAELSPEEESSLYFRFNAACQSLEQLVKETDQRLALGNRLQALVDSIKQQLENPRPVTPEVLAKLENRWEKDKQAAAQIAEFQARFPVQDLLKQMHDSVSADQEEREQNIEKLKASVISLEEMLEQGKSRQAIKLQQKAQKILKNMPQQDVQVVRKQGIDRRLHALTNQINELRDWKRWASTPLKEALVEEMEAIVADLSRSENKHPDIAMLAGQIRHARAEWKKLGESEPDSAEELWERFDQACNRAYEPCQTSFDEQSQARAENMAKRQVICNELERFVDTADWESVNWKKAERILRVARHEWNDAGTVNRKDWAALNKRFHGAMQTLQQKINEERNKNVLLKESLITQVDKLILSLDENNGETNLDEVIGKVKNIQVKWKDVGVSTKESKLWKQFRAACDVVFERRQVKSQAKEQVLQDNLSAKQAICELLDSLSQREGDALKLTRGEFEKAKKDWVTSGQVPRDALKAISQRYKKAIAAYHDKEHQSIIAEKQEQLNILIHKVKLCEAVEFLGVEIIENKFEMGDRLEKLQVIQKQWQETATMDDHTEQAIQSRFQNAINVVIGFSRGDSQDIKNQLDETKRNNFSRRQIMCIRMEIMAGIDSPVEDRKMRMEYQVSQLADKMKQGDIQEEEDRLKSESAEALLLLHEWSVTGPVPGDQLPQLARRFDAARSEFLKKNTE